MRLLGVLYFLTQGAAYGGSVSRDPTLPSLHLAFGVQHRDSISSEWKQPLAAEEAAGRREMSLVMPNKYNKVKEEKEKPHMDKVIEIRVF